MERLVMRRQLTRIKKQKRPFAPDYFYIVEVNNMYQFRDRESHMVLSTTTSLEEVKRCIITILKRYKNYDQYLKAFHSLSESTVSEKQRVSREKEYKRKGHIYSNDLDQLINEYNAKHNKAEEIRRTSFISSPVVEPVPPKAHIPTPPTPLNKKLRRSRLL